jgi:hypothetical protein
MCSPVVTLTLTDTRAVPKTPAAKLRKNRQVASKRLRQGTGFNLPIEGRSRALALYPCGGKGLRWISDQRGEQSDSGRSVYSTDMYGTKILANGKCQYKRPVPDVQTQSLACCEYSAVDAI